MKLSVAQRAVKLLGPNREDLGPSTTVIVLVVPVIDSAVFV
jgi:hypothetical protein